MSNKTQFIVLEIAATILKASAVVCLFRLLNITVTYYEKYEKHPDKILNLPVQR